MNKSFTVSSKYWDIQNSQNTTVNVGTRSTTDNNLDTSDNNLDALLLSLLIPLCVILLIIIVLAVTCYIRCTAYLAESQETRRHLTVIDDDDVVQSKLTKDNTNESNV